MFEKSVVVRVEEGLHARPAARLVQLAKSFASEVEVVRGETAANAKSSVKLMLLGVKENDRILIRARGEDEVQAVEALSSFVVASDAGLAVHPGAAAGAAPATAGPAPDGAAIRGIAASEGVAIGPVFVLARDPVRASRQAIGAADIAAETARFRKIVDDAIAALAANDNGSSESEIVAALVEVIRDREFAGRIEERIAGLQDPVAATLAIGGELAESFAAAADPYLQARAEDVRGATRLIALALDGRKDSDLSDIPVPSIVVAHEISAFDFAKARPDCILGLVCTTGAATSHVAIMARTHGIAAVLGVDAELDVLRGAKVMALDGSSGAVFPDPDDSVRARIDDALARQRRSKAELAGFVDISPRTRDGVAVQVAANLGSLKEIAAAQEAGAMGVGLFRTELLFMERRSLPDEDEQAEVYRQLAEGFAPHPVIVRTLDIGGDKPVAGIDVPQEDNPFLGWRGVRLCLARPDVFKPQLKALLRAAVLGNIKIMVPMVTTVDEVRQVKALLAECRAELAAAGTPHGEAELGIMIETPAAVLLAEDFAREVAFFSIGTNDLTQYVMAADRLNPRVALLNRTDNPAVLRAIALVCQAARKAGIWVGICGEAAADPALIGEFLRLGVTELSMSPASIPRAKRVVTEQGAGDA
jgi:phosphocarrier protein FPr